MGWAAAAGGPYTTRSPGPWGAVAYFMPEELGLLPAPMSRVTAGSTATLTQRPGAVPGDAARAQAVLVGHDAVINFPSISRPVRQYRVAEFWWTPTTGGRGVPGPAGLRCAFSVPMVTSPVSRHHVWWGEPGHARLKSGAATGTSGMRNP